MSCFANLSHHWTRTDNMKNLLILACVAAIAVFAWKRSNPDVQKARDQLGIDANAVVMIWIPACGDLCLNQASDIQSRGVNVVTLDAEDGADGSKLWKSIGGGNTYPVFIIGKEVVRPQREGDLRGPLLRAHGRAAMNPSERHYFKAHFNADDSDRAVLYTAEWCGYCRQLRADLTESGTAFNEIDVEKHPGKEELSEVMKIAGFPTVYVGVTRLSGSIPEIASQIRKRVK